jgi:PncC family amidohydrolase
MAQPDVPESRTLAAQLVAALTGRDESVATAESLTGGLLAGFLTGVPGASAVFPGGVVSYATEVKQDVLDVPPDVVATHGVVSGPCAEAMASGVRELLGTTYGLSTTGVAGPETQEGKPVGTVFVGVAGPDGSRSQELSLDGDRAEIRESSCVAAMSELLATLGGDR